MPTLTFDYRPGLLLAVMLLLFSTLFAIGLGWMASTNDSRIEIFGMTPSVETSTVLLWAFAAFFGLGVPISVKMLLQSVAKPRQVVLTATDVTAPKGAIYNGTKTIPFREITNLRIWTVQRNTFLEIHAGKQKLAIPRSCIKPAAQFDALTAAVEKRVAAARING